MTKTFEDLKGNAEGLLYATEKSVQEYGHVLSTRTSGIRGDA